METSRYHVSSFRYSSNVGITGPENSRGQVAMLNCFTVRSQVNANTMRSVGAGESPGESWGPFTEQGVPGVNRWATGKWAPCL